MPNAVLGEALEYLGGQFGIADASCVRRYCVLAGAGVGLGQPVTSRMYSIFRFGHVRLVQSMM